MTTTEKMYDVSFDTAMDEHYITEIMRIFEEMGAYKPEETLKMAVIRFMNQPYVPIEFCGYTGNFVANVTFARTRFVVKDSFTREIL